MIRQVLPPHIEASRITKGVMGSKHGDGPYGAFIVRGPRGDEMAIVAAGADYAESHGWEHVSVSLANRCPTWEEMCWVKAAFWPDEDAVIQFHPPLKEHVNAHPYCLHLWRPPAGMHIPLPPRSLLV